MRAAKDAFANYLLDACKRNPNWWLPIEQKIFVKLQATPPGQQHPHMVRVRDFKWDGVLPGGHGMRLPYDYMSSAGFARSLLSSCMHNAPAPQDCTRAGSAVAVPSLAETQVLAPVHRPKV